jgi:TetR/AcrR family transcriptional repressor of nem operon
METLVSKGESTRERILAASEALILDKGYAGTSLSDILAATDLTKGAFFHHFDDKQALGRAVVERYAVNDNTLFEGWAAQADRLSDDPLERALIFLKLFEEHLAGLAATHSGCVFASYAYEASNFGPDTHAYIRDRLRHWQSLYEQKFEALIAARPTALPVTAAELAELVVTLIEGGLVMGKAMADRELLIRQSRQMRNYLQLLFRPR